MALIKCPECNNEISDSALTCPHCGYKLKKKKGTGCFSIFIIIIAVVFGLFLIVTVITDISSRYTKNDPYAGKHKHQAEKLFDSKSNSKEYNNKRIKTDTKDVNNNYRIQYDKKKVSDYVIVKTENLSYKILEKNLSEYSSDELDKLTLCKKFLYAIVVPSMISKENLENTLKSIVAKKIENDKDIDEIIIFAYDHEKDIGNTPYTFGKLIWAPYGKLGKITPEIATKNLRDNYEFIIDIKDKVGKIRKQNIPTKRELEIYDMYMNPAYASLSDEELDKLVMRKFGIKSKKELDRIFLKVLKYKNK